MITFFIFYKYSTQYFLLKYFNSFLILIKNYIIASKKRFKYIKNTINIILNKIFNIT